MAAGAFLCARNYGWSSKASHFFFIWAFQRFFVTSLTRTNLVHNSEFWSFYSLKLTQTSEAFPTGRLKFWGLSTEVMQYSHSVIHFISGNSHWNWQLWRNWSLFRQILRCPDSKIEEELPYRGWKWADACKSLNKNKLMSLSFRQNTIRGGEGGVDLQRDHVNGLKKTRIRIFCFTFLSINTKVLLKPYFKDKSTTVMQIVKN